MYQVVVDVICGKNSVNKRFRQLTKLGLSRAERILKALLHHSESLIFPILLLGVFICLFYLLVGIKVTLPKSGLLW